MTCKRERDLAVCALVPYPVDTTPSQRFRIEQWKPYLEQKRISVDLFPFADEKLMRLLHRPGNRRAKLIALGAAFARRIASVVNVRRYDAVLIHRAICLAGPAIFERLLTMFSCPIIYDFDDAIFLLHTTEANRRLGWLKFPRKTATICRLSAHVIVGNSYLGDYARRHNSHVTIIPTSVDTDHYRPQVRAQSTQRTIIGWTGSSTSQTYLEMFAPVLREIAARRDVEFWVHSDRQPVLPGVPFVWRPWAPDTEVEEISKFDIGIMPMPNDEWARGKCAMKALLYMAMSIPAVCSAVGANCEVIAHGKNGLLAATAEDWIRELTTLISSMELRLKLGLAGRHTVESLYSTKRCAEMFAEVVRKTVIINSDSKKRLYV